MHFSINCKYNLPYQIGIISKIEFIVLKILTSMKCYLPINPQAFAYSLIKFIDRHMLDYLFDYLFSTSLNIDGFIFKLKDLLTEIQTEIVNIKTE